MASDMASRRLRKELMAIKRTPIDNIVVSAHNLVDVGKGLAEVTTQPHLVP